MCPQSPSQLVEQYRKEQRLLLNKNLFESDDFEDKIKDIKEKTKISTVQTPQQEEKCNEFLKKLEECKFSAIGEFHLNALLKYHIIINHITNCEFIV